MNTFEQAISLLEEDFWIKSFPLSDESYMVYSKDFLVNNNTVTIKVLVYNLKIIEPKFNIVVLDENKLGTNIIVNSFLKAWSSL